MTEGSPRADLLELQDGLPGGFKGAVLVRRGGPDTVGTEARVGHASEQGLEEIRGEFLMSVAIRGGEFVKHPHELLDTGAVLVGKGTSCLDEDIGNPPGVAGEFRVEVTGG